MAMERNIATGKKENINQAVADGTLKPGTLIITSDTNESAFVDADSNVDYLKERLQEDIQVNGVNIGNWTDGKTIPAGLTIDEFIKQMVQKAIPASYTQPSVTLANNGGTASGNVEAGTSVTPKLRATFNKNDAGALTTLSIKNGSSVVATGDSSPLEYNAESAIVVGDESVTFTAEASYAEGIIKNNNLGEASPDGHIEAGTKTSSSFTYTGKRKLFYGTGVGSTPEITSDVVRGLSGGKLNPANGNQITVNVAVGQQFIVIAYPATLRDITTIRYEEGNDNSMAANFTKSTVDVADARGGSNGLMSYKVYTYAMSVPAPAAMTFIVTI